MRISIQFEKNQRLDMDFGYRTSLFIGMYWFTMIIVDLNDEGRVMYANLRLALFLHPKYWFNSWNWFKKKPIMYINHDLRGIKPNYDKCPDCELSGGRHMFGCDYFYNESLPQK